MKKLNTITLWVLLLNLISLEAGAYSYLYVSDPQDWSKSGQGSIDEAELIITPKGIYSECELFLTLSGNGHDFSYNDSLEINFSFQLPKNSIVHDSWLWVGDSAVHAAILDRWTAFQIYEGIVNRRQDPSVLYKNYDDNYQLNVYPLHGNGSRKIKITYLVPNTWSNNKMTVPLPLDIMNASYIPLDRLKLFIKSSDEWKEPYILGIPTLKYTYEIAPDLEPAIKIDIPHSLYISNPKVAFNVEMTDGIYVGQYTKTEEGYYQMAFLPSEVFNIQDKRKIVICFDFEQGDYVSGNSVYSKLKAVLHDYLDEDNYFNIIITDTKIRKASNVWLKADSANIEFIYRLLGNTPIKQYSKLHDLLFTAFDFIEDNGGEGEVLLLSNSADYNENMAANEFMNELKEYDELPVIHVADYYDTWDSWNCFGGYCYAGNEYLFTMLTRYTGGNYIKYDYYEDSETDVLVDAIKLTGGYLTSFDLYTTLEDGFCHSRYSLSANESAIQLYSPILQVGKMHGNVPFIVKANAIYNNEVLTFEKSFMNGSISLSDSLLEEMWTGNFIRSLENDWSYDNRIIEQIVQASLSERVLSNYTAFLALEPGMEIEVDPDDPIPPSNTRWGIEEELMFDGMVSIDNETITVNDKIGMIAYPNPFYSETRIVIRIPDEIRWQQVTIEVYDLTGKRVKTFNVKEYKYNGSINLNWKGESDEGYVLSKGIYMLMVKGEGFQKSIKLFKAQ